MKPVKYKAWDTEKLQWIDFNDLKFGAHGAYAIVYYDKERGNVVQEMANIKLVEYTGLKDKNGVEIYEGHVVQIWLEYGEGDESPHNLEIIWNSDYARFEAGDEAAEDWKDECEVIGDIYSNPGLMQ